MFANICGSVIFLGIKAFPLCTIGVNLKYILLIYLTYLTSLNLYVFWIKETYSPLQESSAIQLTCYLCLLFFIRLVRGSAFCGLSAWTFSHSDLTILPLLPSLLFQQYCQMAGQVFWPALTPTGLHIACQKCAIWSRIDGQMLMLRGSQNRNI